MDVGWAPGASTSTTVLPVGCPAPPCGYRPGTGQCNDLRVPKSACEAKPPEGGPGACAFPHLTIPCSGAQCQWLGVALDPPYYSCQWATRILKVTLRARSEHGTLPVMAVAACRRCVPIPQARPRPLRVGPLGPCHAVSAWPEAPLALPGAVTTWCSGMILPASPRGPWSYCITGTGTVTAPQCPHLVPCLSTE
jgi:hypothetical protein